MSDKLDPQWIMAQLRELLAGYEQTLRSDEWHMLMKITLRPRDGIGGGITFIVGTEPADEDEP